MLKRQSSEFPVTWLGKYQSKSIVQSPYPPSKTLRKKLSQQMCKLNKENIRGVMKSLTKLIMKKKYLTETFYWFKYVMYIQISLIFWISLLLFYFSFPSLSFLGWPWKIIFWGKKIGRYDKRYCHGCQAHNLLKISFSDGIVRQVSSIILSTQFWTSSE